MKFTYNVNYPGRKITAIGITANGLVYTGVAKCSPEDTFNVKIGKELARLRACQKQVRFIAKKKEDSIAETLKKLDGLMSKRSRLEDKEQNIIGKIAKIKGE